jgi:predicted acylesterase/phospholipase RssA
VLAGGDMRRGQSLDVSAIREGHQTAHAIDKFLMGTTATDARFKDLRVFSHEAASGRTFEFCAQSTPDVPIAQAVRASMSIPIFFVPSDLAKRYPGDFVDGGVAYNDPISALTPARATTSRSASGANPCPTARRACSISAFMSPSTRSACRLQIFVHSLLHKHPGARQSPCIPALLRASSGRSGRQAERGAVPAGGICNPALGRPGRPTGHYEPVRETTR